MLAVRFVSTKLYSTCSLSSCALSPHYGQLSQQRCPSDLPLAKLFPVSVAAYYIIATLSHLFFIAVTFAGFLICGMVLCSSIESAHDILLGFVVSLTGRIAATYHVPFPVIVRSSLWVDVHTVNLFLISSLNSGMWGCIPMIFLRSTVALLWTAISVVQVSKLSVLLCCWLWRVIHPSGWRFSWEYDLGHLAQIPDLESSACIG